MLQNMGVGRSEWTQVRGPQSAYKGKEREAGRHYEVKDRALHRGGGGTCIGREREMDEVGDRRVRGMERGNQREG